jgi:hypothetical protein
MTREPFTAEEIRSAEIEAAREEGFRAGLTAARHVAHNHGLYSMAYVEDEPPEDVRVHNYACWAIRDSIGEMIASTEAKEAR